jgi:hypothetical protein
VYHRRKSFGGHTMRTSSLNVSAAVMAVWYIISSLFVSVSKYL